MKTKFAATNIDKRALRLGLGGALAFALGALTLSPTWTLTDDVAASLHSAPTSCVKRQIPGNYTTANAWQSKAVCDPGEVAISAAGRCPSGATLRGVDLTNGGDGTPVDDAVYIQCSAAGGGALWTATCCQMMALEEL